MKLFLGLCIVSVLAGFSSARASTLLFVNGFSLNGGQTDHNNFYISPYAGVLDNHDVALYCDDFNHEVANGNQFPVIVSDFSSPTSLSATRYFASDNALHGAGSGLKDYEEIAFLDGILQQTFASPTGMLTTDDKINIQDAIWDYFATNGGPDQQHTGGPNGTTFWRDYAAMNYMGKDYSTFQVLTDTGDGTKHQEFLINTPPVVANGAPEPGSIWMLGLGAAMFVGFLFAKRKLGPSPSRA